MSLPFQVQHQPGAAGLLTLCSTCLALQHSHPFRHSAPFILSSYAPAKHCMCVHLAAPCRDAFTCLPPGRGTASFTQANCCLLGCMQGGHAALISNTSGDCITGQIVSTPFLDATGQHCLPQLASAGRRVTAACSESPCLTLQATTAPGAACPSSGATFCCRLLGTACQTQCMSWGLCWWQQPCGVSSGLLRCAQAAAMACLLRLPSA